MVTLEELLGARIRICIERSGYRTVEEFAFTHGLGKSTLSDVLTGKKSPTVSTLARWANALGIPMRDFFEDRRLDEWVREAPPGYFKNRGKTPRGGKAPSGSRGAKARK